MGQESDLQNVDDVAAAITHELAKPTIKDWLGSSTHVQVKKLSCTRDWRNHFPDLGVKLEGGLLVDESGNHLFLCMRRQGLMFQKSFIYI